MAKTKLEYAKIYWEKYELSVTPVLGKVPLLKNWPNIIGDSAFAERYEDAWLKATGIGMLTGKPSNLICLDIDITDDDDDLLYIRKELEKILPPIYLARIGNPKKPPARFFRFNGEVNKKWNYIKVELLSTGNQVLLPPSIHPDTGDEYKWAGLRLSQIDPDLIPLLSDDVIDLLDEFNKEKKAKLKEGLNDRKAQYSNRPPNSSMGLSPSVNRCNHGSHNLISSFAVAKFRAGLPEKEITQAVLAYDKKINSNADFFYFNCPSRKEFKSNDKLTNAKAFVAQIFNNPNLKDQYGVDKTRAVRSNSSEPGDNFDFRWVDDKGKYHPSNKYEDYITLFKFMYPTARKDYFNNTVFYLNPREEWYPVENELRIIRAEARITGLAVSSVEDNLYKWMGSLKPRLLIDIPKWDGIDHIGNVLSYIKVKNISHEHFVELFKMWLSDMWKRVYQPHFHNQCIILKGAQGIGKDMFLGNLFNALNGYYSEITLSSRQKDNYESIEPLIVSYLPEFDESSRIPISTVKAFISAIKATFRGAYDRKATPHTFRHSVVSSANFDNLLRDPTGNRRFWIFELEDINWDYKDILDSPQLMAQAFKLYKSNYQAGKEALTSMKAYIKEHTPASSEELFCDEMDGILLERYNNFIEVKQGKVVASKKLRELDRVRWHQIADDVARIARKYSFAYRTAQSILKKRSYRKRDEKSAYYIARCMQEIENV